MGEGELASVERNESALWAALALSAATGRGFEWTGPGELSAVEAGGVELFSRLSRARIEGGMAGDRGLRFEPETIVPGEHRFELDRSQSMLPLLRAALLPLCRAEGASTSI